MTVQSLTIGKRQFVLLAKRDFEKLAEQAQRQTEDDYWTKAALAAEAESKSRREKPIPFEQIEHELDQQKQIKSAKPRKTR